MVRRQPAIRPGPAMPSKISPRCCRMVASVAAEPGRLRSRTQGALRMNQPGADNPLPLGSQQTRPKMTHHGLFSGGPVGELEVHLVPAVTGGQRCEHRGPSSLFLADLHGYPLPHGRQDSSETVPSYDTRVEQGVTRSAV